jgi:alkaline phosphatase D
MLGTEQKTWLKNWLVSKNETAKFKFILSPIAFTEDFPSTIDSWGNYLTERDEILEFIRENHIEGVLLLTGDSHFAYASEINGAPGGKKGGFLEFSASPISAFDHSFVLL